MLSSTPSQVESRAHVTLRLTRIALSLVCATPCFAVATATLATAGPIMTKEILSVQVRKQGFPCERPTLAAKDTERSTPGSAVWFLVCESAKYRIRLVPNMAAEVETAR